jgi:protein-S-isoprenylcysteine O-methyltransferase Ste14
MRHPSPEMAARIRAAALSHPALWISALLWIVVSLYWEVQARKASVDKKAESGVSRALHVFLVNAALLLLFIPIPGLNCRWLPSGSIVADAGLSMEVAAVILAVWARRSLGANWSGRITIKVEHQLIRSGPYRFVRHPIYTAFLGMYAGTAIVSGEWHALLGLALAVLAYARKIRMEEANLAAHFRAEWIGYCGSTGSLLPALFRQRRT